MTSPTKSSVSTVFYLCRSKWSWITNRWGLGRAVCQNGCSVKRGCLRWTRSATISVFSAAWLCTWEMAQEFAAVHGIETMELQHNPWIAYHFTQEIIVYEVSGEGVFALRGHFSHRARRKKNPPPLPSRWQKALNHVVDTHFKIEIIMAELEYGELGFCSTLVSSIRKNDFIERKRPANSLPERVLSIRMVITKNERRHIRAQERRC